MDKQVRKFIICDPKVEQSFHGLKQTIRLCLEQDFDVPIGGHTIIAVPLTALETTEAKLAETEAELKIQDDANDILTRKLAEQAAEITRLNGAMRILADPDNYDIENNFSYKEARGAGSFAAQFLAPQASEEAPK